MTNATKKPYTHSAAEYLRLPFMRSVVPQLDGSFHAEILEFPGCVAFGGTPDEAYAELEAVAESWIEAALGAGQRIPEPFESNDFSGKTVVRMPRGLHRRATIAAQRDGVSLNQFIVSCIAQGVGQQSGIRSAATTTQQLFVSQLTVLNANERTADTVSWTPGNIKIQESHSNA